MATLAARAKRGAEANMHLGTELGELGKRIGVSMPPAVPRSLDPELQPILETERLLEFVRSVNAALSSLATADEAPAGYDALTVMLLRADLEQRGIEIPKDAKKADLIALLEEDDATRPEGATS